MAAVFSTRFWLCALGAIIVAAASVALDASTHLRPAVAATGCNTDEIVDAEEQAFLALVNQHRAQNGRAPLGLSHTLSRAAAWKSRDMGVGAYFAHDDIGRTWVQRIRDCGYRYNTYIGENIAAGVASAQSAFDLWKNSPGHNANMLGTNYTTIGIGREYVAGSPYGWYWTTEFGGVDDGYAVIAQPEPIEALPPVEQADATPPRLTLGTRRSGRNVTVTARASDNVGVTRVEFRVDGVVVKTDAAAPFEARIRLPRGKTQRVEVTAYDAAGNATTRSR